MAYHGGGKLQQFGPMGSMNVWVDFKPGPVIAVIDATIHSRMEQAMKLASETAKENMQQGLSFPSRPGDMPRADSEMLIRNIEYKVFDSPTEIVGAFGVFKEQDTYPENGKVVDLIYALYLETGTARMDPRPWLTLTVAEVWDQWQQILGCGGGGMEVTSTFALGGREGFI